MEKLLYRYINWDDQGSKKLLSANELFFYSAKKWEKDGEYQFDLVDYTEQRIFDIILEIVVNRHNANFDEYVLWMNVQSQKYGIDLTKLSSFSLDLADQYFAQQITKERLAQPEKFVEGQKQLYFERTGIVSLSKTKHSFILWNEKRNVVGDNVICVGLDIELLKEYLRKEVNCFMMDVLYSNEKQKYQLIYDETGYKTLFQLLEISFSLKESLKFEDEVRLLRLFLDNGIESNERKITLPDKIFKEIVILKDADEMTQAEVMMLAKNKGIKTIGIASLVHDENSVVISNL